MFNIRFLAVAVGLSCASGTAFANTFSTDARSMAMGNTGVVSADFLTAPFHNPALGATYRTEDDFGLLLPAIGATVYDKDDSLTTIDDAQDLYDSLGISPSQGDLDRLDKYLTDLSDAQPLNVNAGLALAISIPNQYMSMNFFGSSYVELITNAEIGNEADPQDRYDNAEIATTGFGMAELGVALAKEFSIAGERVSFGISPKYQNLRTYSDISMLDDFDLDDYDESEISTSAFNIDLGAVWHKGNWRVGVVGKNIIEQEIDTMYTNLTYTLSPTYTVGAGYSVQLLTATVDVDLTEQERFDFDGDETQFFRLGLEFNAWGWAQLRAGYEKDLADTLEDSFTAGIGISPWDLVSLDLAGSYAGENQFGASANLAFTF